MENLFWIGFAGALVAAFLLFFRQKRFSLTRKETKRCAKLREVSAQAQTRI